jgi:hypothetical protein
MRGNPDTLHLMGGAGRRRASRHASSLDSRRTGPIPHPANGTNTDVREMNTSKRLSTTKSLCPSDPRGRVHVILPSRASSTPDSGALTSLLGRQECITRKRSSHPSLPRPSGEPILWAGLIWPRPTALGRPPGAPRTITCLASRLRSRRLVDRRERS